MKAKIIAKKLLLKWHPELVVCDLANYVWHSSMWAPDLALYACICLSYMYVHLAVPLMASVMCWAWLMFTRAKAPCKEGPRSVCRLHPLTPQSAFFVLYTHALHVHSCINDIAISYNTVHFIVTIACATVDIFHGNCQPYCCEPNIAFLFLICF
jgi:hypothetical protein